MIKKIDRYAIELLMIISFAGILLTLFMGNETKTSYIQHTVQAGETVWAIAESYADSQRKPFNEFVYDIQSENKLAGKHIHPGDVLVIPMESSIDNK